MHTRLYKVTQRESIVLRRKPESARQEDIGIDVIQIIILILIIILITVITIYIILPSNLQHRAHTHTHTYTYVQEPMNYMCVYVYMCVCVCVYIYIYKKIRNASEFRIYNSVCKDTALNREFCDLQFQSAFWRQAVSIHQRTAVQKIQLKHISIEFRALPVSTCTGHGGMYIY